MVDIERYRTVVHVITWEAIIGEMDRLDTALCAGNYKSTDHIDVDRIASGVLLSKLEALAYKSAHHVDISSVVGDDGIQVTFVFARDEDAFHFKLALS